MSEVVILVKSHSKKSNKGQLERSIDAIGLEVNIKLVRF